MLSSSARANARKRRAAGLSSTRGQTPMSKNRAEQGIIHRCTSWKRRMGVTKVSFTTEAQRHREEEKDLTRGTRSFRSGRSGISRAKRAEISWAHSEKDCAPTRAENPPRPPRILRGHCVKSFFSVPLCLGGKSFSFMAPSLRPNERPVKADIWGTITICGTERATG
jgi:hypothetical protein